MLLVLKWILIISITMVSTVMLAYVSQFIAILDETQKYYKTERTNILLLSNSFNILYLIITPLIFSSLKSKYILLVNISVMMTGIGCIGRYLCQDVYWLALIASSFVAIGHIPIITAPYGLLDLFPQSQRPYAASIPLFVPTLGINFSILYGMTYIANQNTQSNANNLQYQQINNLNFIMAVVAAVSCTSTFICMIKLKKQIQFINQSQQIQKQQQIKQSFFSRICNQFKGGKIFFMMLCCWGVILGFNWTYGGMFGVIFNKTGLSNKDIALIGLYANLSSVFFSNLGNWISNHFKFSNKNIIFVLNCIGLIASIFIQCLSSFGAFSNQKQCLIVAIIVLRAGFSSFVSLALIELSHCGPCVLISGIFFYIANASNLFGNYLVDLLPSPISLALISSMIFICILLVYLANKNLDLKKIDARDNQFQISSQGYVQKQKNQQQSNMQNVEYFSKNQIKQNTVDSLSSKNS